MGHRPQVHLCGSYESVRIYGPISQESLRAGPMTSSPSTTYRKNVLLVDDDPQFRMLFRIATAMSGSNCSVHEVGDGFEALEFLTDRGRFPRPDLIYIDRDLPGMSGLELQNRLGMDERLNTIPIIMMQSLTGDLWQSGICYDIRPMDPTVLLNKLSLEYLLCAENHPSC